MLAESKTPKKKEKKRRDVRIDTRKDSIQRSCQSASCVPLTSLSAGGRCPTGMGNSQLIKNFLEKTISVLTMHWR